MHEQQFVRSNGETVAYFDYGQSERVVFFHHGTPGAGPLTPHIRRNADANDFRIIEIVRPGYGSSTAISGRTVNTISEINLEVADAFGIERFAVTGLSGGGPHALASAHLAGNRCLAQLIVAGLAPSDSSNFDFFIGKTEENKEEWLLPLTNMDKFEAELAEAAREWSSYSFEDVKALLNVNPEFQFSDEKVSAIHAMRKYSLLSSTVGWKDDQLAMLKPWGFSLTETSMPVQLWAGSDDVNVPPAHAHFLNEVVPNSELRIVEHCIHSTISEPAFEDGFAWLGEIFSSQE